jgi:flavin-dependent dehydrogenase
MYDIIVVGARCAGSPTAMLLARRGYKVLLVDKASFPSDIMSSHFVHVPGVQHRTDSERRRQKRRLEDESVIFNTDKKGRVVSLTSSPEEFCAQRFS